MLAYTDGLMCVENTFQNGAVGALTIDGETREVAAGDTLLKKDGVPHGCTCLEAGTLLDIFNPMREDFLP